MNGSHVSNLLRHDCGLETFDARVHSTPTVGPDGSATVLLRRHGRFIEAYLEPALEYRDSLHLAQRLTKESLVRAWGSLAIQNGDAENEVASRATRIKITKIRILSVAKEDLPDCASLHVASAKDLPPIESRLNDRLLDGRVAATAAVFRLFSGVHEISVQYLAQHDFHHIPTPAFIGYRFPEEDDDYFALQYFDKTARLAPTGEIYLGMALSADLERVYDYHTVFRRESVSDGRHLTEFTMLELVSNIRHDWTEILELADNLLVSLIRSLQTQEKYTALIEAAKRLYPAAGTFKLGLNKEGRLLRLRFDKAKQVLRDPLGFKSNDEDDLTREEEEALGRFFASVDSSLGPPTDVFIITHFPRHLRPCNVYPSDDGDNTSQSFDIIMRGQEIVTGCRLLHSYEDLRSAFISRPYPIDPDSPEWRPYVRAHEIGMPPWGGFGRESLFSFPELFHQLHMRVTRRSYTSTSSP
ncbi:hypothetical protein PFICI_10845 [Pestalotiopsis fici W106-1]|uniref:aspartate--tRNA ligase n=1 Tax=Pestalotiopsis fici (strain W106-1 / CGMCC3.15140) TaxID=1229662 RepID=W3WVT9_PESFW|nr:uncharacterized protein PFICI_10845 [Pestalotiopsis fici W106-1]ETS76971.1 hypothetical protein PFICI_10845 [Pestalotiopsis fici W106-1]